MKLKGVFMRLSPVYRATNEPPWKQVLSLPEFNKAKTLRASFRIKIFYFFNDTRKREFIRAQDRLWDCVDFMYICIEKRPDWTMKEYISSLYPRYCPSRT